MALGVLCALLATVFGYINRHFHDEVNFVAANSALATDPAIQERLFEGFHSEISTLARGPDAVAEAQAENQGAEVGDSADGETEADAPSDPAAPTEEEIARDEAVEQILLDVFDTELEPLFESGLPAVHRQLIHAIDIEAGDLLRDKGAIVFDARRLYGPIYDRMRTDERTAEITQYEVPADYGVFPIADRTTTVDSIWRLLADGPGWRGLTYALAVLSFIAMVVMAERRPSRVIQFGGGLFGLALVALIVIYLMRAIIPLLAGDHPAGPLTAVYSSNIAPLSARLIRLLIFGGVLAVLGWIAQLIWPDDWMYSQVTDERGVRSVRRRPGRPQPEQAEPVPAPYPAPGYGGYPAPGWAPGYPPPGQPGYPYPGQAPYPGQPHYPGQGYGYPGYPAGPYAQPTPPPAVPSTSPSPTGRPTVPVSPIPVDSTDLASTSPEITITSSNGTDDLPPDAAQIVPRVVTGAGDPNAAKPAKVETQRAEDDDWGTDADW